MLAVPGFVLLLIVLWSFGDRMSIWAGLRLERAWERFALSTPIALGCLTVLVFLLAVLRVVTLASCLGLVAAMAALSWREIRTNASALARGAAVLEWKRLLWPRGGWQAWALWLSGLIVLLGLVQALAPTTGMDTGRFHFAAVKMMIREHGLLPRPDAWFHRTGGYYMVYLFGMTLQGEALAKLFSFCVSPLALMLAALGAERLRAGTGRIAAAVVALSPIFTGFTGYEYLELPVLMYLLAAFACFARYRAEGGAAWAVTAATLTGLALGVKVTAFWVVVLLVPMILDVLRREGSRAWKPLALGALGFLVTAGFWPIWNRLTTGAFTYTYLEPFVAENPYANTGVRWLAGLFKALGSLVTTSEYWIDSAGPFVIVCLAGILLFRGPREARMPAGLLAAAVAFYLVVLVVRLPDYLFIDAHARYLGPGLLGFGALAAAPFTDWALRGSSTLRKVLIVALLLPAAPLVVLKAGKAAVAAPAAIGLESRSHYLSKKIETYPACEVLNALPDDQVLVLFLAQRPYYLDRRMAPGEVWWLARNAEDLQRRVFEQGVTHVLFEPETVFLPWLKDPDLVFKAPVFKEIGRWPWKQSWVRLYAVEAR